MSPAEANFDGDTSMDVSVTATSIQVVNDLAGDSGSVTPPRLMITKMASCIAVILIY